MGIWGDGVFENDTAGDFMDSIVEKLVKEIIFWLSPHNQEMFLYCGVWQIMLSVDLLIRLDEYGIAFLVGEKTVQTWKDTFFAWLNNSSLYEGNGLYKSIDKTSANNAFQQLVTLAREYEER